MAAPTNPTLLHAFPPVEGRLDANTELWAVTTHMIVPKGTDVEQLLADIALGKIAGVNPEQLATSFVDVSKVS